jgi:hypothetical protein
MQLFGLLCSLLKVFTSDSSTGVATLLTAGIPADELWGVITSAQVAVTCMLQAALDSSNPARPHTAASGTCHVTAAMPWLVLLGRCCHTSALLAHHSSIFTRIIHSLRQDDVGNNESVAGLQHRVYLAKNLQQVQSSFEGVAQWLAAAGTVQQLADMGYQQAANLQQQLAEAAEALQPLRPQLMQLRAADASAALLAAQEQLQTAGAALACFAIPQACNNLACSNVCGPSEAQLVGGRTCICGVCLKARYCCRACQRAAWRQHKPVCNALATAAAATATATGGRPAAG